MGRSPQEFHLGKIDGSRKLFKVPADLVLQTVSILAKRGVGKSYTGGVMAEEMLAGGHQIVVLDPLDVWWGLRSSADGKKDGLEVVIFGGEHADVPLEESDGKVIARLIVEERFSAIISTRHLSKAAQRRFVFTLCTEMYRLKGQSKYRSPLHLFIDEADLFVPQTGMKSQPESMQVLSAVDDLVRRGRFQGFGVTIISQRAARVNKDVLTQTEVLVCMRTIGPQDRQAVKLWIEAHDTEGRQEEFMESLASMPVGTCWVWSPGWMDFFEKVNIRRKKTFDSSATPKIGAKSVGVKRFTAVDIAEIRSKLEKTIEKHKADDPKQLRKLLSERDRTIRNLEKGSPAATGITQKDVDRAVKDAVSSSVAVAVRDRDAVWQDEINRVASKMVNRGVTKRPVPKVSVPKASVPTARSNAAPKAVAKSLSNNSGGEDSIGGGGKKRIMIALAQNPDGLSDRQIGALADMSIKSGTFSNYLAQLRVSGFIEGSRSHLRVTAAGLGALGDFEPLPVGDELRRYWSNKLGTGGRSRMFDAICNAYPEPISKEDLAEQVDLSANSGTFSNYLAQLRTFQLISGRGELIASDDLF